MTGPAAHETPNDDTPAQFFDLDVPDREVLYSLKDRVATVTLNRPDRLNATNLTLPYSVSKAMLKADKDNGIIRLDSETQLSGVPKAAWDYRLGNRSGLEWILDQYKEKTPKDPTIREKFNTYRFADYKEKVVDLLMRVTRVSVETVVITEAMKEARR